MAEQKKCVYCHSFKDLSEFKFDTKKNTFGATCIACGMKKKKVHSKIAIKTDRTQFNYATKQKGHYS